MSFEIRHVNLNPRLGRAANKGAALHRAHELKKSIDGLFEQRDEVDGIDGYRSSGQKSTGDYKESVRMENGLKGEVEVAREVRTVGAVKAALASGVLFALNTFGIGAALVNVVMNPSTCLNSGNSENGRILNFF